MLDPVVASSLVQRSASASQPASADNGSGSAKSQLRRHWARSGRRRRTGRLAGSHTPRSRYGVAAAGGPELAARQGAGQRVVGHPEMQVEVDDGKPLDGGAAVDDFVSTPVPRSLQSCLRRVGSATPARRSGAVATISVA